MKFYFSFKVCSRVLSNYSKSQFKSMYLSVCLFEKFVSLFVRVCVCLLGCVLVCLVYSFNPGGFCWMLIPYKVWRTYSEHIFYPVSYIKHGNYYTKNTKYLLYKRLSFCIIHNTLLTTQQIQNTYLIHIFHPVSYIKHGTYYPTNTNLLSTSLILYICI